MTPILMVRRNCKRNELYQRGRIVVECNLPNYMTVACSDYLIVLQVIADECFTSTQSQTIGSE